MSNIFQGDGNYSITTNISEHSDTSNESIFDSDDEVDPEPIPVNVRPAADQVTAPGHPIKMEVNMNDGDQQSSYLPLCLMLNARSVHNKPIHFKDLYQLGPDLGDVGASYKTT